MKLRPFSAFLAALLVVAVRQYAPTFGGAPPPFQWAIGVSGTAAAEGTIAVDAEGNSWVFGDFTEGTLVLDNWTFNGPGTYWPN